MIITTSIINTKGWTETMKKHDETLRQGKAVDEHCNVFPIRKFLEKSSNEEQSTKANIKRIKSCDYAQWDKYDPGLGVWDNNYKK